MSSILRQNTREKPQSILRDRESASAEERVTDAMAIVQEYGSDALKSMLVGGVEGLEFLSEMFQMGAPPGELAVENAPRNDPRLRGIDPRVHGALDPKIAKERGYSKALKESLGGTSGKYPYTESIAEGVGEAATTAGASRLSGAARSALSAFRQQAPGAAGASLGAEAVERNEVGGDYAPLWGALLGATSMDGLVSGVKGLLRRAMTQGSERERAALLFNQLEGLEPTQSKEMLEALEAGEKATMSRLSTPEGRETLAQMAPTTGQATGNQGMTVTQRGVQERLQGAGGAGQGRYSKQRDQFAVIGEALELITDKNPDLLKTEAGDKIREILVAASKRKEKEFDKLYGQFRRQDAEISLKDLQEEMANDIKNLPEFADPTVDIPKVLENFVEKVGKTADEPRSLAITHGWMKQINAARLNKDLSPKAKDLLNKLYNGLMEKVEAAEATIVGPKQQILRDINKQYREYKQMYDKGIVGRILDTQGRMSDVPKMTSEAATAAILEGSNKVSNFNTFLKAANGGEKEAKRLAGQYLSNRLFNQIMTQSGSIKPAAFRRFLVENKPLLIKIYGKDHFAKMNDLQALADIASSMTRSVAESGSDTMTRAQINKLVEDYMESGKLKRIGGQFRLTHRPFAIFMQFLAPLVTRGGDEQVLRIVNEMMTDPKLAKDVLKENVKLEELRSHPKLRALAAFREQSEADEYRNGGLLRLRKFIREL